MVKMTFTLDDDTVDAIRRIAERRAKPQSLVVREAVAAYARLERKLDESDRARRLRVLDALAAAPPTRPHAAVAAELRDIRRARRSGWRRSSD
jgi:hypothetical protein